MKESFSGSIDWSDPGLADLINARAESARRLLDDENARDQSFVNRGVGLAALDGAVISRSLVAAGGIFREAWASPWLQLALGFYCAALFFLLVTVLAVLRGVLMPQESISLGIAELERYCQAETLDEPQALHQARTMAGVVDAVRRERERLAGKAKALRRSYCLFLTALLWVAMLGALIGIHGLAASGGQHGRRLGRPAARHLGSTKQ